MITDRSLLPTRIANSASRRSRRRALARAPVVAALALLSSPLATCVEAQRTAAIVAGVTLNSGSPHVSEPKLSSNGEHATGDRAARVSHDALVGAGVGALVGLVASPILNAQNSDHTEDAMTYVVLVSFGAFVGLVAGTIYGLTRGP